MLIAHDLITAEKHADTIEELYLGGADLVEWPRFIQHMPNLRILDISLNRIRASEMKFSGMNQLRFLSLVRMNLDGFPPELFELENLENLRLSHNDLYFLPSKLADLKGLRVLEAGHCMLDSFPVSLCQFPNLETLQLANNELTNLPPAIAGLRSLRFLNVSDNKIFRLPSELALLPRLSDVILEHNDLELGDVSAIAAEGFLAQTANGKLSLEKRQVFMEVLLGHLPALAERNPSDVMQALDAPYAEVRKRASEMLYVALTDPFEDARPKTVCLLGQLPNLHKSKVTKQLQAMQIEVSSKPDGNNCVVIAGDRPGKRLTRAFEMGCKTGVEGHLSDFLSHEKGQYLAAGKGSHNPMVSNVLQMLRSGNEETIGLALNLMAAGGIPKDVVSELAGLSLFGGESRSTVREFLQENGSKRIHRYLESIRHSTPDRNSDLPGHERESLAMALRHPALGRVVLLRHAIRGGKTDQLGFAEVLELPEPLQKELLPLMITGKLLNFFGMHLAKFPRACIGLAGMTTLVLARNEIDELPPEIRQMGGLEDLNLSENHLGELPGEFFELSGLQTLNLDQNRFQTVSADLLRMPALSNLSLSGNPLTDFHEIDSDDSRLEYLNLAKTFKNGVPAQVFDLRSLVVLNVEECGIADLEELQPDLPLLEGLILSKNPISHLPEWLGSLPKLRTLNLSYLPAHRLPRSLIDSPFMESFSLPSARNLDWENILEIVPTFSALKRLAYDRLSPPHWVHRLQRELRGVRFESYGPRK